GALRRAAEAAEGARPAGGAGAGGGSGPDAPDAPRTPLERQLAETWCRLLHVDRVGRGDDFFDLGGNSLAAVRLIAEAERLTGRPIGLSLLSQEPRWGGSGGALARAREVGRPTSLVPLAAGGGGAALYIAHGWGGDVFEHRDLAQRLGPERPVFGLRAAE